MATSARKLGSGKSTPSNTNVSPSLVLVPSMISTSLPHHAPASTAAMGSKGTYTPSRVGPVSRKPSKMCFTLASTHTGTLPVAEFQESITPWMGAARRHAASQLEQFSCPHMTSAMRPASVRLR